MQRNLLKGMLFIVLWLTNVNFAVAQELTPASSPNPVGSGARAIGMGGAFIGVADDATAASWNPGGLVQLDFPEISVVGNWFHRIEDNTFGSADGAQSVSEGDINYLSLVYPFDLFNRNMVFALNYQHLYDFTREWNIILDNYQIDYQQDGSLSAIGVAWGIKIRQWLYFGFTLNLWDDHPLFNRKWKRNFGREELDTPPGVSPLIFKMNDEYSFDGYSLNTNIGLLFCIGRLFDRTDDDVKIGIVFKSPFKVDLKDLNMTYQTESKETTLYKELYMPMSYGIGVAWRIWDELILAGDIYKTEWQDYILRDRLDGSEISPITGSPPDKSDIAPTLQIRAGIEYVFSKDFFPPITSKCRFSGRIGIFYDPIPAEGSPDDLYGGSLGFGFTTERISFDIAFQYRHGNNVNSKMVSESYLFYQDISEYNMYSSVIAYLYF